MSSLPCCARLAIVSVASVTVLGCGGGVPTTPSATVSAPVPTAVPSPSPRTLQPLQVVGRVLDSADHPVAGARVTQWDTANSTTSDANGYFDLAATVAPQDRSFWMTVEKPGFETSEQARSVDTAMLTTLRLHQIRTLAAGESFRSVVSPDDSACGYHWGFVCRRVRVKAPAPGALIIDLISDGAVIGVGIPLGSVGVQGPFERRISVPVREGDEVTVDVGASWDVGPGATFTLNTSLARPN